MINNIKKTTEEFINESKKKFGDKFDYSKTNYITKKIKVCITCKKHGDFFTWPNYLKLRNGGCPKCSLPKGEEIIALFLKHNHILFENQKKFNDLKDKSYLKYDFYLPEKNTLIEFNGKQHYKEIAFFGGRKKFLKQKHHDWLKRKYAIKNNIKLLIIKYDDNISEILSSLI